MASAWGLLERRSAEEQQEERVTGSWRTSGAPDCLVGLATDLVHAAKLVG